MDGISKSIFLWGVICLLGFGVYHFSLFDPNFPKPLPLWSVLTVIGIAAMVLWVPAWSKNKIVLAWIVITVVGMLYHWAAMSRLVPMFLQPGAYWALLMTIGFAATAFFNIPIHKKFWWGVTVLNGILFLSLTFAGRDIGSYSLLLLAIFSGVPLMVEPFYVAHKRTTATGKPASA